MTTELSNELAGIITEKLRKERTQYSQSWLTSTPVQHFVLDNALPEEVVKRAFDGFPQKERMKLVSTIRESKYTSAQMDSWGRETKSIFLAFQHPDVLEEVEKITGINNIIGDPTAYAGGISLMTAKQFLNPHLDNSTHPDLGGYRRLNALFYVTPNWQESWGGNLELWSPRMKDKLEIQSKFNRLVIMCTNRESLHSVNRIEGSVTESRCCVSNYFFTHESPDGDDYQHITSFRGRPDERLRDIYLRTESFWGSKLQGLIGKPLKR